MNEILGQGEVFVLPLPRYWQAGATFLPLALVGKFCRSLL
jgi:hypothetical protein